MNAFHAKKHPHLLVGLALLVVLAIAVTACAPAPEPMETVKVTWMTPRGTLEVMDDHNLWAAKELGYFEDMGIDIDLQAGPTETHATVRMVDEGQADAGYP